MEEKKLNLNKPLLSVRVNRNARVTPKPNRQLSLPSQKTDWELTEVTKPAAVPFVWEQSPGKPKEGSNLQSPEPSVTPRFPPGRTLDAIKRVSGEQADDRTVPRPRIEASALSDNVKDINVSKDSGSHTEDDAYSDALDTLSATGSFSWNCSVSGLSGYDSPSSGAFTADPQTRDLMMTRFLPAARAMVIETPQYVQKKQPEVSEQPRPVKKIVSGELRPLLERYGSTASYNSLYRRGAASDDEDDDEDYNNRGRKIVKACGLLPRLCVKNSLLLLDTVPGTKSRAQSPIPSGREVRRMARTAHSGPLPQTLHEKHDWNDIYWNNIQRGAKSRELVESKLTPRVSDQINHSSGSYTPEGLTPHRRSKGGGISPYRNERPQSPFHDGAKFLGVPKVAKDNEANKTDSIIKISEKFQDVSSRQICKQGSGSLSCLAEKTLYLDSVSSAEVSVLDLGTSEGKGIRKSPKVTLAESRQLENFYTPRAFTRGEKEVKAKAVGSLDADLTSSARLSNSKVQANEGLKHVQAHLDLKFLLAHPNESLESKTGNAIKVDDKGSLGTGSLDSPRAPPLPKSPSESWLGRTMPSISSLNPFSQVQTKKPSEKASPNGAKWETIVKTSHVRHEHLRYSEELIPHVPHRSKS